MTRPAAALAAIVVALGCVGCNTDRILPDGKWVSSEYKHEALYLSTHNCTRTKLFTPDARFDHVSGKVDQEEPLGVWNCEGIEVLVREH